MQQLVFNFDVSSNNNLQEVKQGPIMIVLHDGASTELSHIQAIAKIEEGFGLFDYVKIEQQDGGSWIGQIVQPNRNISTVGGRLDPTILHGLELMQTNTDVQSIASVQVFDILILGQYDGRQMTTPRLRPLPGAFIRRLERDDTINVIGLPTYNGSEDRSNVIGLLLNAEGVPLCINTSLFNYHFMVAGGTGSGKSNAAANLVRQATLQRKCVIIHDAKPDYGYADMANTDPNVKSIWEMFQEFHLMPESHQNVLKIGFHQRCDPNRVDKVIAFQASDFAPEMLAALFFPIAGEQNQFEAFAGAAETLREQVFDQSNSRQDYSVQDILNLVQSRMNDDVDPKIQIHEATGRATLRKVNSRKRTMPWLDVVGSSVHRTQRQNRLQSSRLDPSVQERVSQFNLEQYAQEGRVIIVDYSQMDEESYALILSYFLRISQSYRKQRGNTGIVQLVDEAHRIFDNESRHSVTLGRAFERVMREGRSVDHSIILSLQNASQIPSRVMNNLNSKIVMRQNSKSEADAATQTMDKDFAPQSMRLGTGHALVSLHESRAVVLSHMAPSPYDLMRNDNTSNHSTG